MKIPADAFSEKIFRQAKIYPLPATTRTGCPGIVSKHSTTGSGRVGSGQGLRIMHDPAGSISVTV